MRQLVTLVEIAQRRKCGAVCAYRFKLRQIADARKRAYTAAVKVKARHPADGQRFKAAQTLELEPQRFEPREIRKVTEVVYPASAHRVRFALPIGVACRVIAELHGTANAACRLVQRKFRSDDVKLCHAAKLAHGDIAACLAGVFPGGFLENFGFELAHRVVRQRLDLRCRGREPFKIAREVADDERCDYDAEHGNGYRPAGDLFALALLFLLRLGLGRGSGLRRLGNGAGRSVCKVFTVQKRRTVELFVKILVARIGVLHQRINVAYLKLHSRGQRRLLNENVDGLYLFRLRIVHLTAAIIRAHVGIRDKRHDQMRIGKVRGYALLPLAADLDALIVPDVVAAAVHVAQNGQHLVVVGVCVADENIRFIALVGLKIHKFAHIILQNGTKIIIPNALNCN